MTASWLVPAIAYVAIVGALGVTTKLALRNVRWPDLILWTTIVYIAIAVVLVLFDRAHVGLGAGNGWAALSGVFASGGLIVFYIALGNGPASRVVPITAAYPLVSVVLGVAVLSERVTPVRLAGAVLVVVGVVLLSLEQA